MMKAPKKIYEISKEMVQVMHMIQRFEAMGGHEQKIEELDYEYWQLSQEMENEMVNFKVDSLLNELGIEKSSN